MSTVRKGVIALAVLLLVGAALAATLPWIASTRIVRDRIAQELSLWSGYRVSLGQAPVIDVWPVFKATLHDVAFRQWSDAAAEPVLDADRLEVTLSPLAALRGNVVFSSLSMHRPLLRLTVHGSVLDLPASPGGGRMTRAIETARSAVNSNPTAPDTSTLPTDSFGSVEFTEGRIVVVGEDATEGVTSLNGKVTWPSLNRPGSINATGIWRGENVTVEAEAQPLLLFAGASTPVKARLKSSLLEASFNGVTNLYGDAYFDGQATFNSPSLRRTLEWSKTDIAPGAAIGAISLEARIQGTAQRLRLDSVNLNLGGNSGRGVLEIAFADAMPAISGSLAFEKLNLRSFLSAFTSVATDTGTIYNEIDTGFARQLSLDLRLSAPTASLGSVDLTNLAATAQVRGDMTAFDLSDAGIFGGSVQAGVRIDGASDIKNVEMRLVASDIDAFAAAKAFGAERIVPQGRANVSIMLKGNGRDWNTVMGNAEGTISATAGEGALVGLDLPKFRERLGSGGFFPLSEAAGGTLPFRGFDLKAKVVGGVARVEKADVQLDREVIALTGITPYFSRSLALSGHFLRPGAEGHPGEIDAPFFIGGGWGEPFISPAWSEPEFQ